MSSRANGIDPRLVRATVRGLRRGSGPPRSRDERLSRASGELIGRQIGGLTRTRYGRAITNPTLPTGPDPEAITQILLERYPDTDVVRALGAIFFSIDPEKHWPNYATIVTTDEHDEGAPSNLSSRDGVFRLNIGVGRATFERIVGPIGDPDFAAFDRLLPHPVYAKQLWISIVNPSEATFLDVILPLLDEAHSRLASVRARHAAAT